jgi:hypothetical protein
MSGSFRQRPGAGNPGLSDVSDHMGQHADRGREAPLTLAFCYAEPLPGLCQRKLSLAVRPTG